MLDRWSWVWAGNKNYKKNEGPLTTHLINSHHVWVVATIRHSKKDWSLKSSTSKLLSQVGMLHTEILRCGMPNDLHRSHMQNVLSSEKAQAEETSVGEASPSNRSGEAYHDSHSDHTKVQCRQRPKVESRLQADFANTCPNPRTTYSAAICLRGIPLLEIGEA